MGDILGSGNGNGSGAPINTPSLKRPRLSPLDPEPKSELGQLPSGSLSVSHGGLGCAEEKETEKEKENEKEEEEEEEEEGEEEEEEEEEEEASNSETERTTHTATFTDLKVFDCPSCHKPLCSPVYQCQQGHFACAACCRNRQSKSKCYICRWQTGTIRCIGLEKVLESVTFRCRNKSYGCKEKFKNSKILDHEKACIYTPCACPDVTCNFIGMSKSLYKHFGEKHFGQVGSYSHPYSCLEFSYDSKKSIPVYSYDGELVFLQDRSRSTLFKLMCKNSPEAFVSVVYVAPDSSRGAFSYDLTVVIDNDTFINMKAPVECIPKCTDERMMGKCLLLPKGLAKNWTYMKLELIIRRNPKIAG